MSQSITELKAEATKYSSEISRIKAALKAVAAKETVEDAVVINTLMKRGYIRWSARAQRYMFTDKGAKFYRSMKRFG